MQPDAPGTAEGGLARVAVGEPWNATAEAILWVGDRIEVVGSTRHVTAEARRRGIAVEDLDGRIVIPGFVDAHMHFLHAGIKRTRPDLGGTRSRQELLDRLAQWLAAHPGGDPVIGELWDESGWAERERPTRDDVDRVVAEAARRGHGPPGRVVVLRRVCGHVAIAGSAALRPIRARWDDDALVDLKTGTLLEQPSLYLNEVIPVSPQDLDRAVAESCRIAHRLGVTAVGDYSQAPYRAALQRAAARGSLSVRVHSSIYVQQLESEIAQGFRTGRPALGPQDQPHLPPDGTHRGVVSTSGGGDVGAGSSAWMRDGGLKVFLDGSLGARTAALREPYGDAPKDLPTDCGGRHDSRHGCVGHPHPQGTLNWGDGDVERLFTRAHDAGIQVHAHAIGDGAIDQGLEAYGRLAAREDLEGAGWGENRLRHSFEHYEIVHEDQLSRTAELGIVSSSQPNFVGTWSAAGGMYESRLGARFRLNNRFRTMKKQGLAIAFGSDGMPFGPTLGLPGALEHPEEGERLAPLEGIWHYTYAAAWGLHWESAIGSLACGKMADMVILDIQEKDLARRPASRWRIRETLAGGKSRFRAE
jgi:hypothetical protein